MMGTSAATFPLSSWTPAHSAVIARLDRAIQYAAALRITFGCSGILDPRFRGDDEL